MWGIIGNLALRNIDKNYQLLKDGNVMKTIHQARCSVCVKLPWPILRLKHSKLMKLTIINS